MKPLDGTPPLTIVAAVIFQLINLPFKPRRSQQRRCLTKLRSGCWRCPLG